MLKHGFAIFFSIGVLLISCDKKVETNSYQSVKKDTNIKVQKEIEIDPESWANLDRDYLDSTKKYKISFTKIPFERAIIYDINSEFREGWAEWVFRKRGNKRKEITKQETQEIMNIIKDPDTFTNVSGACFYPAVGIIFFNKQNKIVGYFSLCFQCNNLESEPFVEESIDIPKGDHHTGFSINARKKLKKFFKKHGFDFTQQPSSFDNPVY